MQRRCIDCHRLLKSGSRCKSCDAERWPGGDRVPISPRLRAQVLANFGGCCVGCGSDRVPLQLHHRDRDPTNTTRANLEPRCQPCHRRAER